MARLKKFGERFDQQTRNWGFACVIMASLVLVLAPPPLWGLCPDPENPCNGVCCNDVCCEGQCLTKSDGSKICCPSGQVLCNDVCCNGQCLTKSDGSQICCPAGQMLCNDACCAGPVCCNNETCGFNCSTTPGGPNNTCKVCPDTTGAPNKLCKMCADVGGTPNQECYQCDFDNDGNNDACYNCRTSAGAPFNNCGIDTDGNGTRDCCMRYVANYAALQACPMVKPNPYYTPTPNGCTDVPNNPCGLPGTSFLACCNAHDVAYGTCNTTKAAADLAFYACMTGVCGAANPACGWLTSCQDYADSYYAGVYWAGGSFYEDAQYNACYCCYGTG